MREGDQAGQGAGDRGDGPEHRVPGGEEAAEDHDHDQEADREGHALPGLPVDADLRDDAVDERSDPPAVAPGRVDGRDQVVEDGVDLLLGGLLLCAGQVLAVGDDGGERAGGGALGSEEWGRRRTGRASGEDEGVDRRLDLADRSQVLHGRRGGGRDGRVVQVDPFDGEGVCAEPARSGLAQDGASVGVLAGHDDLAGVEPVEERLRAEGAGGQAEARDDEEDPEDEDGARMSCHPPPPSAEESAVAGIGRGHGAKTATRIRGCLRVPAGRRSPAPTPSRGRSGRLGAD